tara:strand:- start:44287 stop:45045 length:759 start_codon:yes stop_codon:yes gene_type:complete
MATYKKRGRLKSKVITKDDINDSKTAEVFENLDLGASKAENFVAKYQNMILIFLGTVAMSVLVYLGYRTYVFNPLKLEASSEISQAQYYFNLALNEKGSDSLFKLALNGGDGKYGFLDIIENYPGTPASDLAKYSAGISFVRLKQYDKGINLLKDFKSDDKILSSLAAGVIGDSYLELNELEDSLEFYEKALAINENSFTTPKFLFKAAILASYMKKNLIAKKYYNEISNLYPDFEQINFVRSEIGRLENLK